MQWAMLAVTGLGGGKTIWVKYEAKFAGYAYRLNIGLDRTSNRLTQHIHELGFVGRSILVLKGRSIYDAADHHKRYLPMQTADVCIRRLVDYAHERSNILLLLHGVMREKHISGKVSFSSMSVGLAPLVPPSTGRLCSTDGVHRND